MIRGTGVDRVVDHQLLLLHKPRRLSDDMDGLDLLGLGSSDTIDGT